ncbi:cyclic nucleotide-binding domain-containing protein [candidate division KSB1 bacterium]
MKHNLALLAGLIGLISAVSLPIGSLIGLTTRLSSRTVSALMAFGAGALLFALTIEIVAHSFELAGFWALGLGCLIGGLLYELLNHGLNSMGAFLRKTATLLRHTAKWRKKQAEAAVHCLSGVTVFNSLEPSDIAGLIPHLEEIHLREGQVVFRKGMRPDALFVIESGKVQISIEGKLVAELGPQEVFGEIGLLSGRPRTAEATAVENSRLYRMAREDLEAFIGAYPSVKIALQALMGKRSRDLVQRSLVSQRSVTEWKKKAGDRLRDRDLAPTSLEIHRTAGEQPPATLGIWLGILLDGIPESLVIGLSVTIDKGLPWALVAGVFLSNFPEALSSSALMLTQQYSRLKILMMWSSITVLTALGAILGNLFFQGYSPQFIAVIEGTAAGAMLTMIAETMLPEAYERGGTVVGLATLAGFLMALFIKSLSG